MKILEEFWYGNIRPTDRDIISNSRTDKLLKLVVKNEQRLNDLLSEEEKVVFQNFKDDQSELSSVNECESFMPGFRLGARIIMEVMGEMDMPFIDE